MIQRILEPGQIESLEHAATPRIRLPERATVFAARAARLRGLANANPIGGYVRLMASVAAAQQRLIESLQAKLPSREVLQQAQANSMPLVSALTFERAPVCCGRRRHVPPPRSLAFAAPEGADAVHGRLCKAGRLRRRGAVLREFPAPPLGAARRDAS
ncbi:formate dehydrogenase accessory protein FdhE domain-containing protein [Trinickia mobilis]|uniref:formate dehydrogenase accessory protein FdhE domain-containing protein n=1 Tax=Trinickia mobilis TaxID=2816356 RepID=UPI001A8C67ED|nr:formate dehydrogenase accessory protein FdhE [Trinickia mobilis]